MQIKTTRSEDVPVAETVYYKPLKLENLDKFVILHHSSVMFCFCVNEEFGSDSELLCIQRSSKFNSVIRPTTIKYVRRIENLT